MCGIEVLGLAPAGSGIVILERKLVSHGPPARREARTIPPLAGDEG
jgi:hypothetical protein